MNIQLNLTEYFTASVIAAAGTVEIITRDAQSLCNALCTACSDDDYVLLAPTNTVDPDLFSSFKLNAKVITEPTKEQLSTTHTGITDAFCGIASTGSVCVLVLNNFSSAITMLTRKHIVVVDSHSILPEPRYVFDEKFLDGIGLKNSFSFITGPSATADMGPLVRGVHGPGKLHVIVLE